MPISVGSSFDGGGQVRSYAESMRRWIGLALAAIGVVFLCVPYTYTVTFKSQDGPMQGTARCVPLRDALKSAPNGGGSVMPRILERST